MRLIFCFFALLFLMSCKNEVKEKKCRFGIPTAIFQDSVANRIGKNHRFKLKEKEVIGIESIDLQDGTALNILQSGCNSIRQVYQFSLKGDFSNPADSFWVSEAVKRLNGLAQASPTTLGLLGQWAIAIQEQKTAFKIGKAHEIAPKTTVKIDRIISPNMAALIVELAQEE